MEKDGKDYILKTEVDRIVSERLSKVSNDKRSALERVEVLESQLSEQTGKISQVEALNTQLAGLQEQLSHERTKYDQHVTIHQHGISDPDLRDAVLWQFDRAMSSRNKKDRQPLNDWIGSIKENPDTIPQLLRPHFKTSDSQPSAPTNGSAPQPRNGSSIPTQAQRVNQPNPAGPSNLLERAGDPEFYNQNRDAIRAEWYRLKKR